MQFDHPVISSWQPASGRKPQQVVQFLNHFISIRGLILRSAEFLLLSFAYIVVNHIGVTSTPGDLATGALFIAVVLSSLQAFAMYQRQRQSFLALVGRLCVTYACAAIAIAGFAAGSALSLSQMTSTAVVADAANDRVLTTTYDRRGLKTQVTQSAITYVRTTGATASASPTTQFSYNAFGELTRTSVLLDQAGGLWARGALNGKVGGAFTSTATQHGGQESTLLSMQIPLLHHGCVIVGIPYTEPTLSTTRTGGSPYGASHVAGVENDPQPSEEESVLARALGRRVAQLAARLGAGA